MSIRRLWAIMHKEFRHILRDRRMLFMVTLSPAIMLVTFGYVFTFDGSTWAQMGYLKGAVADTDDRLGIVAAISGASLVFSGNLEDSNATGGGGDFTDNSATSAGAAFLFQ